MIGHYLFMGIDPVVGTFHVNFTTNGETFNSINLIAGSGSGQYLLYYSAEDGRNVLVCNINREGAGLEELWKDQNYRALFISDDYVSSETEQFLSSNGAFGLTLLSGTVVLRENVYLEGVANPMSTWAVSFYCSGINFSGITIGRHIEGNLPFIQYDIASNDSVVPAYDEQRGGWLTINYNTQLSTRTLDFGNAPQAVDATLVEWIDENREGGAIPTNKLSGLRKWNSVVNYDGDTVEQAVSFTSGGTSFSSMRIKSDWDPGNGIYYDDDLVYSLNGPWLSPAFRVVDFGEEQTVLVPFYNAVVDNSVAAKKISGKWEFWNNSYGTQITFIEEADFVSNGQTFRSIQLTSDGIYYNGETTVRAATIEWFGSANIVYNPEYKVIEFAADTVISQTLYNFINALAKNVGEISGLWRFIEHPSVSGLVEGLDMSVDFISGGSSFYAIGGNGYNTLYYRNSQGKVEVYKNGAWVSEAYRVVDFGAPQYIKENAQIWITSNASRVQEDINNFVFVLNDKINEPIDLDLSNMGRMIITSYNAEGYAASVLVSRIRVDASNPTRIFYTIQTIAAESGTKPASIAALPVEVEVYNNGWSHSTGAIGVAPDESVTNADASALSIWLSTNAKPMSFVVGGVWEFDNFIAPIYNGQVDVHASFFATAPGNTAKYNVTSVRRVDDTRYQVYVSSSSEPRANVPGWIDVYDLITGWVTEYGDGIRIWDYASDEVEAPEFVFNLLMFAQKRIISSRVMYGGEVLATLFAGEKATVNCANTKMKDNIVIQTYGNPPYQEYNGERESDFAYPYKKEIPLPSNELLSKLSFEEYQEYGHTLRTYTLAERKWDGIGGFAFNELDGEIVWATFCLAKEKTSIEYAEVLYVWKPERLSQLFHDLYNYMLSNADGFENETSIGEFGFDASFLDQGIAGWYFVEYGASTAYFIPAEPGQQIKSEHNSNSAVYVGISDAIFSLFCLESFAADYLISCADVGDGILTYGRYNTFQTASRICKGDISQASIGGYEVTLYVEGFETEGVSVCWQYGESEQKGWTGAKSNGIHTVVVPRSAYCVSVHSQDDVDVISNGEDAEYAINPMGVEVKRAKSGLTYIVRKRG